MKFGAFGSRIFAAVAGVEPSHVGTGGLDDTWAFGAGGFTCGGPNGDEVAGPKKDRDVCDDGIGGFESVTGFRGEGVGILCGIIVGGGCTGNGFAAGCTLGEDPKMYPGVLPVCALACANCGRSSEGVGADVGCGPNIEVAEGKEPKGDVDKGNVVPWVVILEKAD